MDNIDLVPENKSDILPGAAEKPKQQLFYIAVLKTLSEFFHDLGKSVCEIISDLFSGVLLFSGRIIGWLWTKTEKSRAFLLGKLKYFLIFIFSPVFRFFSGFSRIRQEVRTANREYGMKGALPAFFGNIFKLIFGKRGAAVTVFNYALPIISVIFLVNVISYATEDVDYAVRLEVNGKFIGYIENELVFTEAQKEYEERLSFHGSTTTVPVSPQFTIEKVGYSEKMNLYSVANILLANSGVSVESAFGVYINNVLIGAVEDNSRILETLESLLDVYRTGAPDEKVEFYKPVEFQGGLYTTDSIIDPQIIIRNISGKKEEAQFYTVAEGDSQSFISEKLDIPLPELERLNPGFTDSMLFPGDRIKFSMEVPTLQVSVTRTEIYEQDTPFAIEHRDDSTRFEGTQRVSVEGVYGEDRITARVTLVNGIEIGRDIINRETISKPINQVILRGTREVPAVIYSNEDAAYGKFIWPVPRGVSKVSEWHWQDGGYRGHSGIDIAAPYGTPIYAGESGEVTLAGWSSGYGYLVVIRHSNGLSTYYAHCSSFARGLYVGQQVIQGENIAFVGMTGWADGPHLHFEVRQGGQTLNPKGFLTF